MSSWILLICAVAMVLAQAVSPGQAVYHTGWYNAADIALFIAGAVQRRKPALLAVFGCAILVVAGAASGLMGPDTQTIVGAPGASIRNADAGGTFSFPLSRTQPVVLQHGGSTVAIGGGRRYSGSFIMWRKPRTVVAIDAADANGNSLTITQPTNATFLSPVLLMQQSTSIAGMNVRYDTFSVPAQGLNVKAVLFSEQQAAQLRGASLQGKPAVLFAVSDRADRVVKNGIGVVPSGERKSIGGLELGAAVESYPAIVLASAPYLPVLVLGLLAIVAGIAKSALDRRRAAGAAQTA